MTKKQVSWFKLLLVLPLLLFMLVMAQILPKKWKKTTADKVLKMMRNLVK